MHVEYECLGESALLLRFGDRIDPSLNERVHAVVRAVRDSSFAGVEDLVPAYASLLLRFDPACWSGADRRDPHQALFTAVMEVVGALDIEPEAAAGQGRLHHLPVCYGGDHGADLASVAELTGFSTVDVVERHCAVEYRVAMLGFAPGFAYLLGLDPLLQVPRHDRPRTRVPAGSVAIGGAQTGIYPRELPGGWQLLGRTPKTLFDVDDTDRPSLLLPGDRVRFVPINTSDFNAGAGQCR